MTARLPHAPSRRTRGRVLRLAAAGALAFWVVNLTISLTPIAADYRTAMSIAYLPMLLEALLGGLLMALAVTYCLLRFPTAIPGRSTAHKAWLLSLLALLLVTVLLEVPAKYLATPPVPHATRYLLIGTAFNILRISALGAAVAYLAGRPGTHDDAVRADDGLSSH